MNTAAENNTARLERAKRLIRGMVERTEENGCTESEAMEAASKIGALLSQFDLELSEVMAKDTSDMVSVEVYAADFSAARLISGIGKLCSLVVYSQSGGTVASYKMFGHKPDVELGTYLYEICAEAADHGWQQYMDKHGFSKTARDSFRIGFGHRVADRMYELRQQRDAEAQARAVRSGGTSLVLLKDQIIEAEFSKTGIKLSSRAGPKVKDAGAARAGAAHGSTVNLANPLAGPGGTAGLLG